MKHLNPNILKGTVMQKIIFIEPKSPNLHIFSQYQLPRLGIFILGAIMKQMGWDVEVIVEESQKLSFAHIKQADMVGISTITSTAPRAYAIADRLQKSGIPVILGGPHVTFLPDEALEHADYVIRGEGEVALKAFILAWTNGRNFSTIPNLSYKINNKTVHNPIVPYTTRLNDIPFPDFSLSLDVFKRIGGKRIIPFQTSRGCPYDCSFCSVTGIFGKTYRFRSTENVLRELHNYNDSDNFIFFYDDNFTMHRKRAKILLKAMIKEKFKFKWSTQVRTDVAQDIELVKLMKQAGCFTLFIGFESVNPKSLEAMKKRQTLKDMTNAVRVLRNNKIHVHGMFVYGFDDDDWGTVEKTVKFAKKARLTSSQFMILTPFPGSELYNRMADENRIRFKDWSLYDAHHAVFQPKQMSLFELQRAQIFSHSKFYSFMEMVRHVVSFAWVNFYLAVYAHNLNRVWQKQNKTFLKVIELCRPIKHARIVVDYQEKIRLEDENDRTNDFSDHSLISRKLFSMEKRRGVSYN
jgi:radical SAM superfamily enzyme YgiQ (UPF0313 family)